jgi:cytoskeleton protein RodZ
MQAACSEAGRGPLPSGGRPRLFIDHLQTNIRAMSETVGQKLRQARQARSLSLEQVAEATYMRPRYLQALEDGDLDVLPSITQARGFLRSYADFLGLNPDELLAELPREMETAEPPSPALQPPQPQPKDLSDTQVDEIFQEIGEKLRHQRDMLGLSLEDVERHTHLRAHYLQAIENGAIDELPSPVQARGMLNNYAGFIGLDPETLLLKFADALQLRLAARQARQGKSRKRKQPSQVALPSLWRKLFTPEIMLSVFLSVALFTFLIWGIYRIMAVRSAEAPQPTAPSIAEVLLATATVTTTPSPLPPTATLPPPPNVASLPTVAETPLGEVDTPVPGMVQLYVTVNQRAWMRVTVDGKVQFEGRVLSGTAYDYAGDTQVEVLTGNGAAISVFFQGQDLGPMGNFGQVVDRVYTSEGVVSPTATVTATPTQTPRPSPTPRQTGTAENVANP